MSDGSAAPAGQPVAPGSAGALCLKDDVDEIINLLLSGVPVVPGGVNNPFFRELTPNPFLNPFGVPQVVFPQASGGSAAV